MDNRLSQMFWNSHVKEVAHGMWEAAGRPEGDGKEFWYAAEEKIRLDNEEYDRNFRSLFQTDTTTEGHSLAMHYGESGLDW